MVLCTLVIISLLIPLLAGSMAVGQTTPTSVGYRSPAQVAATLKQLAVSHSTLATVEEIGKSTGGTPLYVLRIADASQGPKIEARPAILITANLEGNHLIGTEAALQLADRLLSGASGDAKVKELLLKKVVYIAPVLNPDAAASYFSGIRTERTTNGASVDDDLDGVNDEDGPDDLNRDGVITMMRVKDPEGEWIVDPNEPRLMKKADPQKGESGVYRLYPEGLDNDADESYNEDPPGGVDLNHNFPHDFEHNLASAGRWPVSQAESKAILDFMVKHSNIALVLNFSSENTILNLEQTGRARASESKVRIPERYASFLGVSPEQDFDLKEVVELIKGAGIFGGMEVTEDRVAQMLGLGPAVAIDRQDLPIYEAVQKDFKEGLKAAKSEYPEKKARGVGKGSFVAYCYYQYGVPVFSLDIWSIPEPAKPEKTEKNDELTIERLKGMTNEQFLALEESKLEAFLKAQGAPAQFGPAAVRKMVESGQSTPAKLAEMAERMARGKTAAGGSGGANAENPELDALRWSDTAWGGKGFVAWTPFTHPTLGSVEIGGFVPYLKSLPPPEQIEKFTRYPVDFYMKLMEKTAGLTVKETKVKALEEGVYSIAYYLTNPGWFPTSTAQGRRAQTSWPITVRLNTSAGQTIFSGRPIETVQFLPGGGETRKVEWTVRGKPGSRLEISASSPKLGLTSTQVTLQ